MLLLSLFCVLCVASLNAVQWVTAADPSRHPPAGGNGDSSNPLISADGRFVLFASVADNLVVAGSNAPLAASLLAQFNVFLRNRSNRVTALVSLNLSYLVDRAANTSKLMGAVRPGFLDRTVAALDAAARAWEIFSSIIFGEWARPQR